jgi:bifunctional DNA-binding transcriptional regulator/antitoxin component of YhaV-PrlF toxin-antitoxin module
MTLKQKRGSIIPSGKASSALTIPKPIMNYYKLKNGDEISYEWDAVGDRFIINLPEVDENGEVKISKNKRAIIKLVKHYQPVGLVNLIKVLRAQRINLKDESGFINDMIREKLLALDSKRMLIIGARAVDI